MSNRPTPSNIRKLSGSNLHRINPKEPRLYCYRKVETVPVPKAIEREPIAKEEWDAVLPGLVQQGLIHRQALMILANYCLAHAAARHAEDDVIDNGRWTEENVFNTKGELTGTKRKINPNISLAASARVEMLRHAIEFGMTPAAATKVQADPGEGDKNDSFEIFDQDSEAEATHPN